MPTTCAPVGWGFGFGTVPWGGGSGIPGGDLPKHPPYDVYCVGPCADMELVSTYIQTALSGTFATDTLTGDLVLTSSGTETTCFLDTLIPQVYTLDYTCRFDVLPPTLDFLSTERVFVGVFEDSGATVGLYFSEAGVGVGTVLGEAVARLPGSHTFISAGVYYTIRLAVSLLADVVYFYMTESSQLDAGGPHVLRCILALPSTAASMSEGTRISVLGTPARPLSLHLASICLGSGLLIPNQPPQADSGQASLAQLCSFHQLDGSASYDPEGVSLSYLWRLLDAPPDSAYAADLHDGHTAPLAPPTGYTNKLYSADLGLLHASSPVLAGDVVSMGSASYTVLSVGTDGGGFYAQVSGYPLADNLTNNSFRLLWQTGCFRDRTAAKPVFYADKPGVYKFDLVVFDGELYSEPSVTAVTVVESSIARGVVPFTGFIWDYLSDFWRLVEDKERIETVWGALAQIISAQLLQLWQVDYNKSLADIQQTAQRRWLYYDLLLQEPFVELTTVACMDNREGYLAGSDGFRSSERSYSIVMDLSDKDVQPGDYLVLSGEAYRILKYHQASPHNLVVTSEDVPLGIGDWRIVRPSSSQQLDFYSGLVTDYDDALLEIRDADGILTYARCQVFGACREEPGKVALDPTPVLAELADASYTVLLAGVFRRSYVPINTRVVDIPTLQVRIANPPEEEVLRRNVDFFLDSYRGKSCLRFDRGVWVHLDGEDLVDDPTPPVRLWAETTYIENLSVVEANFGIPIGLTLLDVQQIPDTVDYLSAVRGLWYIYFKDSTLTNLRAGMQVLFGLPYAEQEGTIIDLRVDLLGPKSKIFVQDDGEAGVVREYVYPRRLPLETNPDTGVVYSVGDRVQQFAPLTQGVELHDWQKTPDWIGPWVTGGVRTELDKLFRFCLRVSSEAYTLGAGVVAHKHLVGASPTYTEPIIVVSKELDPTDIDVNDSITFRVTLSLFDGSCFRNMFGIATMWDQPDPRPVLMSAPPDGGVPVYQHIRNGVTSGWMSAYDEVPTITWNHKDTFSGVVSDPTPVTLPPGVDVSEYDRELSRLHLILESSDPLVDFTPLYEVAVQVGGVDVAVVTPTITWSLVTSDPPLYRYDYYWPVTGSIPANAEMTVIIRPLPGCTNTPAWSTAQVLLTSLYRYTFPQIPWGHDDKLLCPEEDLEAVIMATWGGGVPTAFPEPAEWSGGYPDPLPDLTSVLFVDGEPLYEASVVDGHIVLGSEVLWDWVGVLAPGVYGRTISL